MSQIEQMYERVEAGIKKIVKRDVSNFMKDFKAYCRNDQVICRQIYRKITLDLNGNPVHTREFTESPFDKILDWIQFKVNPSNAVANCAEERESCLEGYTRKTSKGEEEIHREEDICELEFKIPRRLNWKDPAHISNENQSSVQFDDNIEADSIESIHKAVEKWSGFIHGPFGSFKGSAYQIYGPTENITNMVFSRHMCFEKQIEYIEMDQYLRALKKEQGKFFTAFWVFPDRDADNEFKKVFSYYQSKVGTAINFKRPYIKDIFILSVAKHNFAPSIFKVEYQDNGIEKHADMFITSRADFARDRLLVICSMFVTHPYVLSPADYIKYKRSKK